MAKSSWDTLYIMHYKQHINIYIFIIFNRHVLQESHRNTKLFLQAQPSCIAFEPSVQVYTIQVHHTHVKLVWLNPSFCACARRFTCFRRIREDEHDNNNNNNSNITTIINIGRYLQLALHAGVHQEKSTVAAAAAVVSVRLRSLHGNLSSHARYYIITILIHIYIYTLYKTDSKERRLRNNDRQPKRCSATCTNLKVYEVTMSVTVLTQKICFISEKVVWIHI